MKHNAKTLCPDCPDMIGRPAYLLGRPKECRNYDPSLDGKILGFFGKYRFLSNFYMVQITYDGIKYPSVEHAYQAAKSTIPLVRELIANMSTPQEAKKAGKMLYRPDWKDINLGIMEELIRQKFKYVHLQHLLLDTENAYLEETNTWRDVFWGVCNGIGENHLGKILMKVREDIKNAKF